MRTAATSKVLWPRVDFITPCAPQEAVCHAPAIATAFAARGDISFTPHAPPARCVAPPWPPTPPPHSSRLVTAFVSSGYVPNLLSRLEGIARLKRLQCFLFVIKKRRDASLGLGVQPGRRRRLSGLTNLHRYLSRGDRHRGTCRPCSQALDVR